MHAHVVEQLAGYDEGSVGSGSAVNVAFGLALRSPTAYGSQHRWPEVGTAGAATGPITYTLWWNCSDPGTIVSAVAGVCGDPTNAAIGATFAGVLDDPEAVSHTYAAAGSYSAKVIVERGSAAPVEQRVAITVTNLPDLTVSAVVVSSYVSGQANVAIPVTVTRTGGSLTQGTYVTARLYWSSDAQWDASDTQLWESNGSTPDYPNTTLNATGAVTVTASLVIPVTAAALLPTS